MGRHGFQSITKPSSDFIFSEKPSFQKEDQKKVMEQLHQTAGIYHDVQIKELAQEIFKSVNTAAGEEKTKLRQFLSFRTADASTQINNRPLFKELTGGIVVNCSIM